MKNFSLLIFFVVLLIVIVPKDSFAVCKEAQEIMKSANFDLSDEETARKFSCLPPKLSEFEKIKQVNLIDKLTFTKDVNEDQKSLAKKLFRENDTYTLENLEVYRVETDEIGMVHIRTRYINTDIEVLYHYKDGKTSSTSGEPNIPKNLEKIKITKSEAIKIARTKFSMFWPIAKQKLVYSVYGMGQDVPMVSGWEVHPIFRSLPIVVVNGITGEVIYADNGIRY